MPVKFNGKLSDRAREQKFNLELLRVTIEINYLEKLLDEEIKKKYASGSSRAQAKDQIELKWVDREILRRFLCVNADMIWDPTWLRVLWNARDYYDALLRAWPFM